MKKRLLSAALALAMVLTLLPVSAFAESPSESGKTTVTYAAKNIGDVPAGSWYWTSKSGSDTVYHIVSSGVVASTGNSGKWYSGLSDMLRNGSTTDYLSTTITLLQSDVISTLTQNLTVDVNGNTLTISDIDPKVTSLKVSDSRWNALNPTSGGSLSIADMATGRDKSGMTLTLSNIAVGVINIKARANTINLTSVEADAITLDGETPPATVNGSTTYATQKLTATGGSVGSITVVGDNSTVSLQDTDAGSNSITLTGTGGSVTVGGTSKVGTITVGTRQSGTYKAVSVPKVTVNGGKVDAIVRASDTSTTAGEITIGSASAAVNDIEVGSITTWNGTVTINKATVTGETKVGNGTLNINGPVSMGNITLAYNGNTYNKVAFNVKNGGSTIGDVTLNSVNSASTISIPADRTNKFGTLSLDEYAGKGIKGGAFKTTPNVADNMNWFDDTLHFTRLDSSDSRYYYYTKTELSDAIADLKSGDTLAVLQPNGGVASTAVFMNGNMLVATLNYRYNTSVILPNKINGTPVTTWTGGNGVNSGTDIYPVNKETSLYAGGSSVTFNLQSTVGGVTKLTNATVNDINNPDVKVTVGSNQISLSGAVSTVFGGGDATILVKFYTDLLISDAQDNGKAEYVSFEVPVTYNPTTKTGAFGNLGYNTPLPSGVVVKDTTITVGSNVYTLNVSGLGVPASNINIDYDSRLIQVNFSGSGWTDGLKNQITGYFDEFDWTNSVAIRQAVNEVLKSVNNNSTVNGYITAAQRAAWTLWNTASPDAANLSSTGYDDVYLVPYLNVTVSQYLSSGTLTFTAVPSYRIEVRGGEAGPCKLPDDATHPNRAYIAKAGASLGTLTSDLVGSLQSNPQTGAVLKMNLPSAFDAAYMHQDGTYVYEVSSKSYTITHGGNTGLGTISLNNDPYSVRVDTSADYRIGEYTSLQAAVNDTKARPQGSEDIVTIESNYTGTQTISLTGEARTIKIVSVGNTNVVAGASGTVVTTLKTGHEYMVQLLRNTAPTGQNIVITSVTGGTARVNVNPATVGQTVTITLTPATGYVSNGVSVRTDAANGVASTNVPVSGSGNTYTFTMPAGSVTVTPAFRLANQTQTQTTVTVSSPNTGSAITSAVDNKATPGSVVTVTTYPGSGQRTMGVNISTNGGSATATRTGVNTFRFTVPANATSVVVTPTFDVDNKTVFSDVWSSEYYSNPVAWAVSNGVTDGTSTYTFSPNNYCTRAQMVTFLWRAAGRPSVANVRNPFVDVSTTLTPGDYYSAILWAVSEGITDGKTATRFAPNDIVTRGQAVTFLYRFEKQPAAGNTSQFRDVPSSEYYAKPVSWAANRAVPITTGKTTTTFDPNAAVTRAQAVTFLYRDRTNKLA